MSEVTSREAKLTIFPGWSNLKFDQATLQSIGYYWGTYNNKNQVVCRVAKWGKRGQDVDLQVAEREETLTIMDYIPYSSRQMVITNIPENVYIVRKYANLLNLYW